MSPNDVATGARARLSKAEQFLRSALRSLEEEDWDAVVSSAVLAGMAACDGYLLRAHGVMPDGPGHRAAARMLRKHGGPAVADHAEKLDRLVAIKSRAQYSDRLSTERQAREAVARAERLVTWAKRTIEGRAP